MAKDNLDAFKSTKEGKYIRQFGTLLIISAVLTLVFMFFIFILSLSSPNEVPPFLFIQVIVSLIVSIYFINTGSNIRKYKYDPYELKGKIPGIIIATLAGGITGIGVFLNGFIWIELIMLARNWNKKYMQAYGSSGHKTIKAQEKHIVIEKPQTKATKPTREKDEYEDEYL